MSILGSCAEIVVGPTSSSKTFYLHKQPLCNSSGYFEAALNNGFAETISQKIILDDKDPQIFHMFAHWLDTSGVVPDSGDEDDKCILLLKLYFFADKRDIAGLANDTITRLASYWTEYTVFKSENDWMFCEMLPNGKLYDLVLDNMVLELRNHHVDVEDLTQIDVLSTTIVDLLARELRYRKDIKDQSACMKHVLCHYHILDERRRHWRGRVQGQNRSGKEHLFEFL
ncbi:hypothetical protein E4T43_00371 [Aureobasidium subglaciale]|nr:hypothetical protein E4T43_00371 [Aureobasidium subglaciale]